MTEPSSGRRLAVIGPKALLLLFMVGLLVAEVITSFRYQNYAMAHDESEHIHVVFALDRGERPYIDFIENHPVAPHLVLLGLSHAFELTEPGQIYALARGLLLSFFAATIACIWLLIRLWRPDDSTPVASLILLSSAMLLSGVWQQSTEWTWGHRGLWQVRPDWACFFFSVTCVYLHLRFLRRLDRTTAIDWALLVIGALFGGLATAILAKSALIFAPYALTLVTLVVLWPTWAQDFWYANRPRLLLSNLLFVTVGMMTFATVVATEIHLTSSDFRVYWTANFKLNSFKHLALSAHDFNPANVLKSLSGLSLLMGMFAAIWLIARFSHAIRKNDRNMAGGLIFLVAIIVVNSALPAFGNGLTWPQYFIPSLLALWALGYLLLGDAWLGARALLKSGGYFEKWTPSGSFVRHIALVGLLAGCAIILVVRTASTIDRVQGTREVLRDTAILIGRPLPAFLPEERLPSDLTYLVFEPPQKPANAKAWGYFHMLSHDAYWWIDNHKFGIGPDPENYWRELFKSNPPDVIAIGSLGEFLLRRYRVAAGQGVDISWLWREMKAKYRCVTDDMLRFHVRTEVADRFSSKPWKPCKPDTYLFLERSSHDADSF